MKAAHEHIEAMRREYFKPENKEFRGPEPPVEFTMDDYDKAVQDPEYIRRISEPVTVTPPTPIANPSGPSQEPQIKQEPMEGPITEIPQEEPAQKPPRKSREESNLKSEMNGPYWQCTQDHPRRTRHSTYFIEQEIDPNLCKNCKDWDSEDWDNIYFLEASTPGEAKDERD